MGNRILRRPGMVIRNVRTREHVLMKHVPSLSEMRFGLNMSALSRNTC